MRCRELPLVASGLIGSAALRVRSRSYPFATVCPVHLPDGWAIPWKNPPLHQGFRPASGTVPPCQTSPSFRSDHGITRTCQSSDAGSGNVVEWRGKLHAPARWLLLHGTDQRLGVSFDQQDGSAVGGWTEYGVIGAYAHTARHAVKCAEWCRTQDVAWRSSPRTGRAGFRLR